jgi:hypothetical protein
MVLMELSYPHIVACWSRRHISFVCMAHVQAPRGRTSKSPRSRLARIYMTTTVRHAEHRRRRGVCAAGGVLCISPLNVNSKNQAQ